MKSLIQNKVFRIVAIADLIQQLGIWIRNIAILFYVMEQTNNDPVAVSLITVFQLLPIFLFSIVGGTLADRWNPKKTVIAGDLLSSASIAVILICIVSGIWQAAFVATVVSAVVSQFSQPSSAILFKRHIPDAQVGIAIGITQGLMSVFLIVGPMIGTLIYTSLGIHYSMIALMILFAAAALIQFALPPSPRDSSETSASVIHGMREGLVYVLNHRNLTVLAVVMALFGLGVGIIEPLDVYILMERLGLEKESLQWFYALAGIGLLIGGAVAAGSSEWLRSHAKPVMFAGILALAASIAVEVLSRSVVLTGSMRFLVGMIQAFFQIVMNMFMIQWVEEKYVGRTSGILAPIITGGILLGSASSGFIMKSTSLMTAYFVSAAIIAIAALYSLKFKISAAPDNQTAAQAANGKRSAL